MKENLYLIEIWKSITNSFMRNLHRNFSKLSPHKSQKLFLTYLKPQQSAQRFFYNTLFLNSFSDKIWLTVSHNLMILFKKTIIFLFINRNSINKEVAHFALIHNMFPKFLYFSSLFDYTHIMTHYPCNILNNRQYIKLNR